MSDESCPDIVTSFPFSHVAYNRILPVSDVFSLTGNSQFGLGAYRRHDTDHTTVT